MAEFRMPSLGADMDEGTLVEWLVRPGQSVHRGDIVAVVETSKATIEVECFDSGVVDRLLAQPGARVPVGTPLAVIDADGAAEQKPATAPAVAPAGAPTAGGSVGSPLVRRLAARHHMDLTTVHGTGPDGRVTRADVEAAIAHPQTGSATRPDSPAPPGRTAPPAPAAPRRRASPLARRLASELGVDVTGVAGTGPGGAVTEADVRRVARDTTPAATAPATVDRREAMRSAIAALMARSKREVPHYYLTESIDLGPAVEWLRAHNRRLPVPQRVVPAAVLLKACALALRSVPELNGFWIGERFVPGPDINLGVAVSLRGGGLVAPAIHAAADLDVDTLMARMRDLVSRARVGRLRGTEMTEGTVTVSNMGEQGAESILGVIYPPQVALIGLGRVVDRPWAADGLLGVRPVVTASLSADHRATDGATGARFLQTLARLLRQPEEL